MNMRAGSVTTVVAPAAFATGAGALVRRMTIGLVRIDEPRTLFETNAVAAPHLPRRRHSGFDSYVRTGRVDYKWMGVPGLVERLRVSRMSAP